MVDYKYEDAGDFSSSTLTLFSFAHGSLLIPVTSHDTFILGFPPAILKRSLIISSSTYKFGAGARIGVS